MRTVHRIASVFVVIATLYLGVTGMIMQYIDVRTLLRHPPATDPELMAMREAKDGTDDYVVLSTADYTASAMPEQFDYQSALPRMLSAAQTSLGDSPVDYAEFRMAGGAVTGFIHSGKQLVRYDFTGGKVDLGQSLKPERAPPSTRANVKRLHRMNAFGNWALWINPVVSIALGLFVVTGVVMYWQLLSARKRIKRPQWFWFAGGWWRTLHRWISVTASVFILVIALSGLWLAIEALAHGYYVTAHRPAPDKPMVEESGISPLALERAPGMLSVAMASYNAAFSAEPIKVVRLRMYGGMPQGAFIYGMGDDTQQVVFNASDGRRASLTEPGYPPTGFPFGFQAHQIAKQIHRGTFIGASGRWMDIYGGLAIIYLSVSGIVMYVDMWRRRRRAGRNALLWT